MQQSCGGAVVTAFRQFLYQYRLQFLLLFLETLAVHVPSSSSCITVTAYLPVLPTYRYCLPTGGAITAMWHAVSCWSFSNFFRYMPSTSRFSAYVDLRGSLTRGSFKLVGCQICSATLLWHQLDCSGCAVVSVMVCDLFHC